MNVKKVTFRPVYVLLIIGIVGGLMLTGCAGTTSKPSGAKAATKDTKGDSPSYYDFGDVLIPSEMKVDKDASFIYKTPGFSAGVLILKGRVERNSLINFFEKNMTHDQWRLVSSFKSPRTMMLFHKDARWCVISISEKEMDIFTRAEIWVSPTINQTEIDPGADTGLLK
jgi:hypothetical protein